MTSTITVEPHRSAQYAVTRDYTILAIHALNILDPSGPVGGALLVLGSRQMLTSGGAHVWAPPTWVGGSDIVAFCQTTEAAVKYRTYIREQDREAEEANS
jgi:hypothetical protein